jgi:flagellin
MGLRINTNVTAITAQRNLALADARLFTSVQRLSSGLRINTAADDPAGLAISEQLRAQIAGLNAAIVNTERSINLVNTIEGALNEVNSLLIGMRELALDAANSGINNATSLAADQAEIDNALQTIDRISDTTQFSIQTLLDGTFENSVSLVSPNTIGLTNMQESTLRGGTYSINVSNITTASASILSDPFDLLDNVGLSGVGLDGDPEGLEAGPHTVVVTGAAGAFVSSSPAAVLDGLNTLSATVITITSAGTTAVVTFEGDEFNSVDAIVAEMNNEARDFATSTAFLAVDNEDDTYSIVIDSNNTAVGANQTLTVTFADVATAQEYGFAAATVTAANGLDVGVQLDDGATLRVATGTTEFIVNDAQGGSLTLTFEVAFATQNLIDGATLDIDVTPATFDVQLGNGRAQQFTAGDTQTVSAGEDPRGNSIGTLDISFGIFNIPAVDSSVTIDAIDNSLQFQVGPNPEQTVHVSARDISTDKLARAVVNESGFRALEDIDVTNVQGANDAIRLLDKAIDEITRLRAKLGAFSQNTLQTNLRSLRIAEENLSASESTIRDMDISTEISEFTRNQILLSAGVSVLAQANAVPQTVLQLLG